MGLSSEPLKLPAGPVDLSAGEGASPQLKLHPAVPQGTPLPVQYPPSLGRSSGQPHGVLTPAAQVDSPKQGGSYFF